MCGIVISKNYQDIEKIKHRGIYKNIVPVENNLFLQHVSLPIQTDESNYVQPLIANKYYILYNGEIFDYNRNLFENDLEFIKYTFENYKLNDAIEIILKFDGFYSFCIYDIESKNIYMFTDPLGKKQLYYKLDEKIRISSEIRGLIDENEELDFIFKSSVIKNGYYFSDDRTPFLKIKRVMPGILYIYDNSKNKLLMEQIVDPYVYFININKYNNKDLESLIEDSVRLRINSIKNYPIGFLYSGGLDSSIILYHLCKLKPDKNITIIVIENEEDFKYAELGLKYFNISTYKRIYIHETYDDYPNALIANEYPQDLGSVYPNYKMFETIKKEFPEIRVVFTGDGADELFGGYRRNAFYKAQESDVFQELTFYHLPRLDKLSMYFTLELRNPFLSNNVISYALNIHDEKQVKFKNILKTIYKNKLPSEIINRNKTPLKSKFILKATIDEDIIELRKSIYQTWLNSI